MVKKITLPQGRRCDQVWYKVPGKTKHLVWRACHNILPTRESPYRRNIVSSNVCPVCHQVGETVTHTPWGCLYARDVWCLACPRLQKSVVLGDDFMHIARYLFELLSTKERDQWMAITWALWAARNKAVFKDFLMPPSKVVEIGNNLWGESVHTSSSGIVLHRLS
uniref:Reverse transcriptase zinc-binding domain-containing protein n=1 Tax=Fagus sylvatica TaxID=28930 RepID=A0A2N9FHB0_FAGSY